MKVLQINCVYKTGSTGKIVYDIHTGLQKRGIDSAVCYGRGARVREPRVYKTCSELYAKANNLLSRVTGLMYGGCFFSTRQLLSVIRRERPDVVHLHCINGYFVNLYRLIRWLNERNIRTVLTLHAEFQYTANCAHAFECEKWKTGCGNCPRLRKATKSVFFDRTHASWQKMQRAFHGFENLTVVSVSPWLTDRAKQSPILKEFRHVTILNGIDSEIFLPYDTASLRSRMGLQGKRVIAHVTAFFSADPAHNKGGYYVLELAKRLPDTMVIVIAAAHESGIALPGNVILLGGTMERQKLAQYYSMADVTLLTSRRETFSMPVAESLCCGTPVVGFCAGAPEQIALKEYSAFVEYGDLDALEQCLDMQWNTDGLAERAKKRYAAEEMVRKYVEVYRSGEEQ